MNPERLVVGLSLTFGTADAHGRIWRREQFVDFVESETAVPLLAYNHALDPARIQPDEIFGAWRAFALVEEGSTPSGLLSLGEIEHSVKGEHLLADLSASLDPWGNGIVWGMSTSSVDASEFEDDSVRWIAECTLTRSPRHPLPRLIAAGPFAGDVWTTLTGSPVPNVVTADRPMRRRLIGATVSGKPLYGEE